MSDQSTLRVGSLVVAQRTTGVCGVCYERYTLDNRPGWSILFESGRHDGFSPDEVALIREVTGDICREVADYEFKNIMRLMDDFRSGRFAPAFLPEHGA